MSSCEPDIWAGVTGPGLSPRGDCDRRHPRPCSTGGSHESFEPPPAEESHVQQRVRTDVDLNHEGTGNGEPLLLVMGTSGSIELSAENVPRLAERYRVIAFDNRGLGGSECGEGPITPASKSVADRIPGARYELVSGPGLSHCLFLERPEDVVFIVHNFPAEHPIKDCQRRTAGWRRVAGHRRQPV